jgi:hypothetical protein
MKVGASLIVDWKRRIGCTLLATTVALSGCQTIGAQSASESLHFGLVRVRFVEGPETSRQVETFGAWLENGAGLGWRKSGRVTVASDCQVVFLVKSWPDFERARAWVRAEEDKGAKLCVALEDGSP